MVSSVLYDHMFTGSVFTRHCKALKAAISHYTHLEAFNYTLRVLPFRQQTISTHGS